VIKTEHPKLLVVTGNQLSPNLAEYALTVAVRLDLEVIVLFVNESSHDLSDENRRNAVVRFKAEIEKNASAFTSLAWASSIKVTTIVDVNDRETAIARAREQEPEIRFILYDKLDTREVGQAPDRPPRLQVLRNG